MGISIEKKKYSKYELVQNDQFVFLWYNENTKETDFEVLAIVGYIK